MNITSHFKTLGSALLLLCLTAASTLPAQAQGRVEKRDFEDWLDVQTSQFGWTNNPDINGDGVDDGPRYLIRFDYAHLTAPAIGTVTGSVMIRPTLDGREDVTVSIEFEDVLLRVNSYPLPAVPGGPRPLGPMVFGCEAAAIANGAIPALATGKLTLNFLQDAGAPFGNFRDVWVRGDWYASTMTLHGEGLFTDAFDPDVESGTPGVLRWGKPYRTPPANENASNGAYSQFPNDEFHLFPVGPR
jgi:hypothetical protein